MDEMATSQVRDRLVSFSEVPGIVLVDWSRRPVSICITRAIMLCAPRTNFVVVLLTMVNFIFLDIVLGNMRSTTVKTWLKGSMWLGGFSVLVLRTHTLFDDSALIEVVRHNLKCPICFSC